MTNIRADGRAIELAEGLLVHTGIGAEGFRETCKALISLDYETTILIAVEERLIHLIAVLGPVVQSPALHLRLLEENFKSVGHARYRYAVEPETGELLMSLSVQSEGRTVDGFIHIFEAMVEYARVWCRSLAAGQDSVPEPEQPPNVSDAAGDDPISAGTDHLLRV